MITKIHNRLLNSATWVFVGLFFAGLVLGPQSIQAATVDELIAKAKQEGALNASAISSMKGKTTPKLAAAFKKRFGLDINVTIVPLSDTRHYPKAVAATKAGIVPPYDTLNGSGPNNIQLLAVGGVQKIDGWESLLAEIDPRVRSGKVKPKQISPDPFSGYAFQYIARLKAILYNPKLISKEDLPKTHAELTDAKYKGKWTQPPWSAHWDIAPLVFPEISKDKWLETVKRAGENAGNVQSSGKGTQRVLLGEYAFGLGNTYYFLRIKAKDPQAPLGIAYFQDYNPITPSQYIVRKGALHPAAATLFALWMVTPEAKAIWQPDIFVSQFQWGESDLDKKVRKYLRENNAKIIGFDGEKGVEFLRWIGTPEGRRYRRAVSTAIRGEKWKKKKRGKKR